MRGERPKEIGLSASGFCSESNPSPGSKISMPEFGYGLFVARHFCRTIAGKLQPKVIHRRFNDFTLADPDVGLDTKLPAPKN